MHDLANAYPWTSPPLIAGAPMRLISLSSLATAVSNAGGLGFIGAGSDVSILDEELKKTKAALTVKASDPDVLPIGVGFLLWAGKELLDAALPLLAKYKPAAVWLFAPEHPDQLATWTTSVRAATKGKTNIWIQIGTVSEATTALQTCHPDVLVVQGADAGGHGLQDCAGLITLLPEVADALDAHQPVKRPALVAAGGITESRGAAAALTLGASGVVLGTRLLASPEANIAPGYQRAVLRAADGGVTTARGKLYDALRGTTSWPERYGGRGVLNQSWWDAGRGLGFEDNRRLYEEALGRGDEGWGYGGQEGRLTAYAGTGVGLVVRVMGAGEIVREIREGAAKVLRGRSSLL